MASPHRPVDSSGGQIRLLVLHPATELGAPIVCTLETAYLHLNPQYEALSYTWGSPGRTHEITINDVPFTVWENAEAALRRLRYIDKPRRLWIDAICINQSDSKEKGEQLLLMQKIYPRADRVCVWLGESTELSSIGMAKVTLSTLQISQMTSKTAALIAKWGDNIHPFDDDIIKKMSNTELADHVWELEWGEVRELLARPWWSRVWIIQEAVLAKSLVLMCGPDSTPWESLEKALKKQPRDVRAIQMFSIKLDPNDSMVESMFHTISHFREQRALNRWSTTIYELLYEFRRLDCTNPRDRIYGVLGLAANMAGVNITPSYEDSVSTAEIYTEFARTMIRDTGSLSILNCVREWRGVLMPEPQAFAYSVFNQSSYHDTSAHIRDEEGKDTRCGWALLPQGWQRVKEGTSCHYFDWNTNTKHTESPLLPMPPRPPAPIKIRRKCPPGWKRSHDNLGRVQVKYSPALLFPRPVGMEESRAREMAYLPSWVPNWATKTHIDPEPLLDWSAVTPKYWASGSTRAEIEAPVASGDPLNAMGFVFDEIFQLAEPWHPSPNEIPISRLGISSLEQWETLALVTYPNCPYGGSSGRKEALWHTYIADFPGPASIPSTRSYFVECWYDRVGWKPTIPSPDELAAITSNRGKNKALTIGAENQIKWNQEMSKLMVKADKTLNPFRIVKQAMKFALHGEKEYGNFVRRIHRACAHRRLFVTKKGYMGLAPWNAEIGDSVVILFGGQTPFLLRQDPAGSEWYKLVGETFVYGIMGGEAMAGSPELQRFRIF